MNFIQFLLFLLINNLFVAKYASRITPYYPILMAIYTSAVILVYIVTVKKNIELKKLPVKTTYITLTLISLIGIFTLLHLINPYSVKVDRWSAIHNFLQNLFSGQYPYAARTHLGGYGSPFPVWQFFHIPFYLLGDVGLAMPFAFALMSIMLVWLFNSYKQALLFLSYLIISPAFWYEAAVRSDLLYNMILCFLSICILYKKNIRIADHYVLIAILCGLFLSTRLPIVIPFSLYLLPDFFKSNIKAKLIFILVAAAIFVISFLPLVFWNSNMLFFFKYNPFILQTRQGSVWETIIVATAGIYLSTKWKDIKTCFFYTSTTLIVLVVLSIAYRMYKSGNVDLFSTAYDITYFNMALPFIIFILAQTKIKTK